MQENTTQPREITVWDDPKEIRAIKRNREVIKTLARYIGCTQGELTLALDLRSAENAKIPNEAGKERDYQHGYHSFQILKSDGVSFREINDPAPVLKNIQSKLLQRLRQIPISSAVTGGEPGFSPMTNVSQHIRNGFLVTMDIKSAFPNTTGARVSRNLVGTINKQIDLSYPHLTPAQRKLFLQAVITLVSKDDQLPQGAPTSTHLLNVVLASTDRDILTSLHGEGFDGVQVTDGRYTRYVDDLAISWRTFSDFVEPWKLLSQTHKHAMSIFGEDGNVPENAENLNILNAVEGISCDIETLSKLPLTLRAKIEPEKLREKIAGIKAALERLKKFAMEHDQKDSFEKCFDSIGKLNLVLGGINQSPVTDGTETVTNAVTGILKRNGWIPKDTKTRVWKPGESSTVREITGITIGHDGKLGIPNDHMQAYIDFANAAATNPRKLPARFRGPDGAQAIAQTLQGMASFILSVKGHLPPTFKAPYEAARSRFFHTWTPQPARFDYGIISGAALK